MKLNIDRFVLSILMVILLAYVFPEWGLPKSGIPLSTIASVGVSLIFFFYGLKLSAEKLKSGLSNWKLHLMVQGTTFFIFPLLVLAMYPLGQLAGKETLWLAFLFLAALPSTVSSSVVMVSIARGNMPAAIFNASISGIIGIAITPLWMGLFLQTSDSDFDLGHIYVKLLVEILLPVLLGLSLQRLGGQWAQKHSRYLTIFDKSVILLIIYKSFAESFAARIFETVAFTDLLLIAGLVLALFYGVFYLTGFWCQRLGFRLEDTITAQFCGTKKSLVHGTVFSKILFGQSATIGIMLLPLMVFHALQILIVSGVAARLGKRE